MGSSIHLPVWEIEAVGLVGVVVGFIIAMLSVLVFRKAFFQAGASSRNASDSLSGEIRAVAEEEKIASNPLHVTGKALVAIQDKAGKRQGFRVSDAAAALGVPDGWVMQWGTEGHLQLFSTGNKQVWVTAASMLTLIDGFSQMYSQPEDKREEEEEEVVAEDTETAEVQLGIMDEETQKKAMALFLSPARGKDRLPPLGPSTKPSGAKKKQTSAVPAAQVVAGGATGKFTYYVRQDDGTEEEVPSLRDAVISLGIAINPKLDGKLKYGDLPAQLKAKIRRVSL